nr:transposase [Streptomyces canus]
MGAGARSAHRFRDRARAAGVPLDQDHGHRGEPWRDRVPKARLALRIHRRRQESGKRQTRETVYAVTSLDTHQASPADLGGYVRGRWGIENSSNHVRDVVFAEDASTVHTGNAPRTMAALRNLAIGRLRLLGADNIAKTTRAIRDAPEHAFWIWGITDSPPTPGT